MTDINKAVNQAFIQIAERAEHSELQVLVNTFVDIGNLLTVLSTRNNQVIYGRRGAGKTHALKYLYNFVNSKGDIGLYIDLRSLGDSDLLAVISLHLDLLSSHVIDVQIETDTVFKHPLSIRFGTVEKILKGIAHVLESRRIWLLWDEWSSVPLDIQPYLADFIRKSILPVENFIVKIASIEHRSCFYLPIKQNEYVGIELGADMSVAVSLDDYLVFDNDPKIARAFFQELLYKHFSLTNLSDITESLSSSDDLLHKAFTQITVFDEFVRASEGVPRDAMIIIGNAAQKALFEAISVEHIRNSARNLYLTSKNAQVSRNASARSLLEWTIDTVIKKRKARAFLLRSNERYELIDFLFDNRVLHIMKRNISARDQPGIKYDVYKIDYGCYVELINTSRSPQLLLPFEEFKEMGDKELLNVPFDDYRSIRRAILDMKRAERFIDGIVEFSDS